MKNDDVKEIVREGYSKIAKGGCCGSGLGCDAGKSNEEISRSIGYSNDEMMGFSDANLGLGCGNPVAMAAMKKGGCCFGFGQWCWV